MHATAHFYGLGPARSGPLLFATNTCLFNQKISRTCVNSCSHAAHALSAAAAGTLAGSSCSRISVGKQRSARRTVVALAWFGAQHTCQLWNYQGSSVRQLSLEDLQLLHRLSFGHRNQRSYLIILYRSDSPACQAFEQEVERLAAGLRHELSFVAAALDVSDQKAANFAASMLGVQQVPAVLLYPEAARGFLKFLGPDMSAPGMLAAINSARRKAWPASTTSPGAPEWQLQEPAIPIAVTAVRAAAQTGDREAVRAALQQQLPALQPTPLAVAQSTYWSQGRVMFWSGLLLCSFLLLAWDLKLADAWEDWCLARRQAARARGKKFTVQENVDDMVTLFMTGIQQKVTAGAAAGGAAGQQQAQQQQQNQAVEPTYGQAELQQQQQELGNGTLQAAHQAQAHDHPDKQQQPQQDLDMKQQRGSWVLDQSL